MKAKLDSINCFKHFKSMSKTMFNATIQFFQCDRAKELVEGAFKNYLDCCGISL